MWPNRGTGPTDERGQPKSAMCIRRKVQTRAPAIVKLSIRRSKIPAIAARALFNPRQSSAKVRAARPWCTGSSNEASLVPCPPQAATQLFGRPIA